MVVSVKQRELGGTHLCEGDCSVQYMFVHACQMPWSVYASGIKVGGLPALFGMNYGGIAWWDGGGIEQAFALQTDLYKERPAVADFSMARDIF